MRRVAEGHDAPIAPQAWSTVRGGFVTPATAEEIGSIHHGSTVAVLYRTRDALYYVEHLPSGHLRYTIIQTLAQSVTSLVASLTKAVAATGALSRSVVRSIATILHIPARTGVGAFGRLARGVLGLPPLLLLSFLLLSVGGLLSAAARGSKPALSVVAIGHEFGG